MGLILKLEIWAQACQYVNCNTKSLGGWLPWFFGTTLILAFIAQMFNNLEETYAGSLNAAQESNNLIAQNILSSLESLTTSLDNINNGILAVGEELNDGNENQANTIALETIAENIETLNLDGNENQANTVALETIAENIETLNLDGLENINTGITGLAGNVENAANSIGSLTSIAATSNTDTKAALQSISASIDGAAGHLQSSASQTSNIAATLNTFSSDTKISIDNIKTALDAAGNSNDASLLAVRGAIEDFKISADSDTAEIISAMNLYKDTLDERMTNLQEELDEIETAITNAQVRQTQLNAVERLAKKIECTTDCYVSLEQAHAIVRGLDRNNMTVEALVDGTDEDIIFARNWINETLKEPNLTEDQVNLKHFILSDQESTSRVFGPVIME